MSWSRWRRWPALPAQHVPGLGSGVPPAIDHDDAVDQHPLDPGREFPRSLVRGAVIERVEIEHRHVGPRADSNHAPAAEAHARRRPGLHLPHRLLETDRLPVLHVPSDDADVVAEAARVWETGGIRDTNLLHRAGVAADARPRETERGLDVTLAHHVVNRHHAALPLSDEIPRHVRRVATRLTSDLGNGFGLVLRVRRIARVDQDNALPTARCLHDVPPPWRASPELALEPRPDIGTRETRPQRIRASLVRPARDGGFEPRSARGVHVHVGG